MKKTILMLVTASALTVCMTSCKKEHEQPKEPKEAIQQTIDVKMNPDQSYSFTLPKNLRDDAYEIISDAKHFSVSKLTVSANGDRVYEYTPAAGYVGNDQVIVSNDQERAEHRKHKAYKKHHGLLPPLGKRHPHKDCKGKEEDHHIITINFVMESTNDTDGI